MRNKYGNLTIIIEHDEGAIDSVEVNDAITLNVSPSVLKQLKSISEEDLLTKNISFLVHDDVNSRWIKFEMQIIEIYNGNYVSFFTTPFLKGNGKVMLRFDYGEEELEVTSEIIYEE